MDFEIPPGVHIHHMKCIFESTDGQRFCLYSAKRLSELDIWEGNRLVKEEHVKEIEKSVGENISLLNQSVFRVISVMNDIGEVKWSIIDGQHRAIILKRFFNNPFNTDFKVIVAYKFYDEGETGNIISQFKILNNVVPIEWKEDPKMMSNEYIAALLAEFQPPVKKGKPEYEYFREGKTKKPFLSIDKIRELLISKYGNKGWIVSKEDFVCSAVEQNVKLLDKISNREKQTSLEEKMIDLGFALSADDFFLWI
jgi:hypothetical protein